MLGRQAAHLAENDGADEGYQNTCRLGDTQLASQNEGSNWITEVDVACSASMFDSMKAINSRTWRTVEVTEWLVAKKS